MLTSDSASQLDELLGSSLAAIDIPDDIYDRAVSRYENVAAWLADWWSSHAGGEIYSQGSIRLGTMVSPVTTEGQYDLDLVSRRDISKASTSQQELKDDVGDGLAAYVASGPEGQPRLTEGKRCWTLEYPHEPYHMDVLPALPNPDSPPNGIIITDRDYTRWLPSNPRDYASWFHDRAELERRLLREVVAEAKRMDVEDVPDNLVKTTLQRAVQALKRHRDLRFAHAPDQAPASIIITTLAARAYHSGGGLYEVLLDVTNTMASFVEDHGGVLWVPNPVQPGENFADRWRDRPDRARRFFDWLAQAQDDFADIGTDRGVDRVLEKVGRSFGGDAKRHAGERLGVGVTNERDAGRLRMRRSGLLGTGTGITVRPHTFHGDAPSPRRS